MRCSSDHPNSLSTAFVRMVENDTAGRLSYPSPMPRKATPARTARGQFGGPDWFLADWMDSKQITQADLCRSTGWSKATVNDIYHGRTEYYRAIVNQLATALRMDPWELLMTPAEANRIKRWRAAFEDEQQLRVAENQTSFTPADHAADRLAPRRAR